MKYIKASFYSNYSKKLSGGSGENHDNLKKYSRQKDMKSKRRVYEAGVLTTKPRRWVRFPYGGSPTLMCPTLYVTVFWNTTTHSLVDIYRRFGRTFCLHLLVLRVTTVNMDTAGSYETHIYQTTKPSIPEDSIFIASAVRISTLTSSLFITGGPLHNGSTNLHVYETWRKYSGLKPEEMWSWVLLERLTAIQIPSSLQNTREHHRSPSWIRRIQSTSHYYSFKLLLPFIISYVYFPFLRSSRRIRQNLRPCVTFCNMLIFTVKSYYPHVQPPSWRVIPYRMYDYSMHSQLASTLSPLVWTPKWPAAAYLVAFLTWILALMTRHFHGPLAHALWNQRTETQRKFMPNQ
jgi:hypothetical protein